MSKVHAHSHVDPHDAGIRAGDVVFFHNHFFFGKIIQWFTKSYWNHTALVSIIYSDGEIAIVESSGHGVRPFLISKNSTSDKAIYRPIGVSVQDGFRALRAAQGMGNSIYDWPQILGFILKRLFGWKYRKDSALVCSELVAEAWTKAGINLYPEKGEGPTPGSLAKHSALEKIWGASNK